ncbi:MAG: hypothetical protein KDD64_05660 [Bdellovibrionales bacterium]|nr:hypothetical protein [Bdellovibrionales bacterium]
MNVMKWLLLFCMLLFPLLAYGHGIHSATAQVALRPGGLIEVEVQYNLVDLLNHGSQEYSLPIIASLSEEQFELLHTEVLKLFTKALIIKIGERRIGLHIRFPTSDEMFAVIKREFIEAKIGGHDQSDLYTLSDRRFYQKAYFDFRLVSMDDLKSLSVEFPKELGPVYVTYIESKNSLVSPGALWEYSE